ncbi:hypothetical protein BgiMline_024846 [Biomphalaria glabrata]|uniref:Uncharacterized protein LOC106070565 n=1 Tax=Biomphalaria glabrata TaxID=6526 RepID=A0A9W3BIB0_BIOGL|nr:uncharacterized protein LOC106070565 [Biomphalaria glabrata]XP_055899235.1 uncharacterized protein LOC106070565 [Biomphalaria glabrata]XP_055899236.1 uncharacterized protein LOC106070565 [Biomphalaria glabrata]XP_055899237.1 uncharacterized protein LOC106070565 [Biomphalaria glabrata]XP_055899238.1 uncharacterized protein LOC106070565 [Biomphalaria glabrata]XP_055899239.1 uncharacterized protein LOC106070565 [Biomphalaria glabrata]XP_055899240.1 uncharacterized protein LOC106070565 [Biomph
MSTVDLYKIVNSYLDLSRPESRTLTRFGKPQILLNKLQCHAIRNTEKWSSTIEPVTISTEPCDVYRNGAERAIDENKSSIIGECFKITKGLAKGYEKSVKIQGPRETGYEKVKIRPGKQETDSTEKFDIRLNASHRTRGRSEAEVSEKESCYIGNFKVDVKLYGMVRFLSGSGKCIVEMPFQQIVADLKRTRNPGVSMLHVDEKDGLPYCVTWTIEGEAQIHWDYTLTVDWV